MDTPLNATQNVLGSSIQALSSDNGKQFCMVLCGGFSPYLDGPIPKNQRIRMHRDHPYFVPL